MKPLIETVYIHIPFCLKKCAYCDFLSFPDAEKMESYVMALLREMELASELYFIRAKTIFIGGGTPSCLPEHLLKRLLEGVNRHLVGATLQEYTMEANPGTLTQAKLKLMRRNGVNRLSLGVQSSHAEELRLLGRIHTFGQAKQALCMAREAGFKNVNLDFMYGLPGQSMEAWQSTLEQAVNLQPEHLSLYQLKLEEGTRMYEMLEQGEIEEFDDQLALEMYRTAQDYLKENGYLQYEISNYAREGYASRHNQVYWRTENYLGLGLGACSWVRPKRWNNYYKMDQYLAAVAADILPGQESEVLTEQEQMEETVFMALRMNDGIETELFRKRFSRTVEDVFPHALECCMEKQLLKKTTQGYALTEEGRVLGNLVFLEFIE